MKSNFKMSLTYKLFVLGLITLMSNKLNAQVKIGDNPSTINSCSILELESSDKGILIPRMTAVQRVAISSPAIGLMVYQTDEIGGFYFYDGSSWASLNNPTVCYAQLSDSTIQQPTTTNPTPIVFSTNDEIQGITHLPGSEEIEITTAGVYNMTAQPQVARNGSGGAPEFHCWFQEDTGSGWQNVEDSNILLDLNNANMDDVIIISLTKYLQAGDKIRVMMSTSDATQNVRLKALTGIPNEPNIPSIIFTIFKI